MEFLTIKDDGLYLSSGLKQEAFARTKMTSLREKTGIKVTVSAQSITHENFTFDDTRIFEDGTVFFHFPTAHGKTLDKILKEDYSEERNKAVHAVLKAFSHLIKQDILFDALGAGGILLETSKENDFQDVFFLPPALFELCTQNSKKTYADLQGKWLNKNLSKKESLIFTRSVIAYTFLAGTLPFQKDDTSRRQEDIYDENFLPLGKAVFDLDEDLAQALDAGLKIFQENIKTLGRRKIQDKNQEEKLNALKEKISAFSSDKVISEAKRLQAENSRPSFDFITSQMNFLKNQQRRISTKRFLRRNGKRISFAAVAALFGFWAVISFHNGNMNLASTTGLTSYETTNLLYHFIHKADVPNLQEVVSGGKTKDLTVKISGFYVRSKERQGYNQEAGTVSPQQWLFFKENADYWMYGITNLKIDGKEAPNETEYPKRKDKKEAITKENDRLLKKGDETTHEAEYFFVHSDAATIYVEKIQEKVTLRWNGKNWKVTQIEGKTKSQNAKKKSFTQEYFASLSENDSDIGKTVNLLQEKYEWLPQEQEIISGAEILVKEYGSTSAESFLNERKPL